MAASILRGVRVDTDGTRTDIEVPAGGNLHDFTCLQLRGFPEFGHYGRPGATITVVVHETSQLNGMPVNRTATDFVGHVRGAALGDYELHGPVLVFGYDPMHGDTIDLPDNLRTQLHALGGGAAGGAA